jgi:hypothetical protein
LSKNIWPKLANTILGPVPQKTVSKYMYVGKTTQQGRTILFMESFFCRFGVSQRLRRGSIKI